MSTVLYRLIGFEVLNISLQDRPFTEADTDYYGVLTDPSMPDGTDEVDPDGNLRVLGYAKFADVGTNTVRNATQIEIDAFAAGEQETEQAMDIARAMNLAEIDPIFRKIFKAFLARIIDEVFVQTNAKINEMIDQWNQHKADIDSASSLATLRTLTNNLPAIQSNLKESVTLQQAIAALKNDIENSDT